jgi:chromosome segregation ATPase
VTTHKPNPAPHSEEELLEQWAFLDRLVEKQAAQLRAGLQDAEEVDESTVSAAEVDGLRHDVDRLRAELHSAQAAREAAEAAALQSRDALIALTATHQQHLADQKRARERHHALEREATAWRERAEATQRELASRDLRDREEIANLSRRLSETEAARQRAERDHAEVLEALSAAHLEIENLLRAQIAAAHHHFWRFRRH